MTRIGVAATGDEMSSSSPSQSPSPSQQHDSEESSSDGDIIINDDDSIVVPISIPLGAADVEDHDHTYPEEGREGEENGQIEGTIDLEATSEMTDQDRSQEGADATTTTTTISAPPISSVVHVVENVEVDRSPSERNDNDSTNSSIDDLSLGSNSLVEDMEDARENAAAIFPVDLATSASIRRSLEDYPSHTHQQQRTSSPIWARLLCWPLMIPIVLLLLVLFIIFCAFPLFLFLVLATCLYYCCTPDPVAPRLLWIALWQDEVGMIPNSNPAWGNTGSDFSHFSPAVVYTAEQVRNQLIRRRLLERFMTTCTSTTIQKMNSADHNTVENHEQDDAGDTKFSEGRFVIRTARETLIFSPPLPKVSKTTATKTVDQNHHQHHSSHHHQHHSHDDGGSSSSNHSNTWLYLRQEKKGPVADAQPSPSAAAGNNASSLHGIPTMATMEDTIDEDDHCLGTACDICLLDYTPHDVVAWSPNPACDHAYHEHCIADWLVRKTTCPSCRQEYLRGNSNNNNNSSSSSSYITGVPDTSP